MVVTAARRNPACDVDKIIISKLGSYRELNPRVSVTKKHSTIILRKMVVERFFVTKTLTREADTDTENY